METKASWHLTRYHDGDRYVTALEGAPGRKYRRLVVIYSSGLGVLKLDRTLKHHDADLGPVTPKALRAYRHAARTLGGEHRGRRLTRGGRPVTTITRTVKVERARGSHQFEDGWKAARFSGEVLVTIDLDALAQEAAGIAIKNRTGRARVRKGKIIAKCRPGRVTSASNRVTVSGRLPMMGRWPPGLFCSKTSAASPAG
jgi:hypothetical protein